MCLGETLCILSGVCPTTLSELVPVIPQSMVQSFRKTKHAKDLAAKMHPERSLKNKRRIAASSDDGGEKE